MTKKKPDEMEQELAELTADLQRVRADFENYRKRIDSEKQSAREFGQTEMVKKLLPVIDDIDRAVNNIPAELVENTWVQGIGKLEKNIDKSLAALNLTRIQAKPGTSFNPDLHHAVQFDEDSEGDQEVIAEQLQPGYLLAGKVLREAMVKVKKQ